MLGNISGALVRFIVWLLAGKLFVSKCRVTVTYIRGGFSSTVLKGMTERGLGRDSSAPGAGISNQVIFVHVLILLSITMCPLLLLQPRRSRIRKCQIGSTPPPASLPSRRPRSQRRVD